LCSATRVQKQIQNQGGIRGDGLQMAKEFRTKDKSKWVDSQDFKVPTSSG